MVADETEWAEVIGKTSEVIGNTPELGVKNAEVKVKKPEVMMKTPEMGVKKPEVKVKTPEVGVKNDFDVLMGAYRSDFRKNARKVLLAFAENPGIDIVHVAKKLDMPEIGVLRAVRALKEVGLLVREGATKGSRWIVKPGRR